MMFLWIAPNLTSGPAPIPPADGRLSGSLGPSVLLATSKRGGSRQSGTLRPGRSRD